MTKIKETTFDNKTYAYGPNGQLIHRLNLLPVTPEEMKKIPPQFHHKGTPLPQNVPVAKQPRKLNKSVQVAPPVYGEADSESRYSPD